MPSEIIIITGRCGKELQGKLWKQGGSVKCPDHWAFNTYPKPTPQYLRNEVWRCCEGCESIKGGSK